MFFVLFSPGCTLLSAGNVVKNKFTPALLKGNVSKVAKQSTRNFSKILRTLSDKDLKLILALGGVSVGSSEGGSSSKKSKMPPVKLISFDSSGNRAVLTAGQ